MLRRIALLILLVCPVIYGQALACTTCNLKPCPDWFALFYYGKMTNDNLGQVIRFDYTLNRDTLYSFEIGKELSPCNPVQRFFQPIFTTVDVRTNFTLLDDTYGNVYELNPYLGFNWKNFPWNCRIKTVITVGEGLSYVSKIPYAEEMNSDQTKKLLNFLLFEIGFALPSHPEWELVARIHHRSGVFGLYHANNSGSTAVGLALRYRFGFAHCS